VESFIKRTFWQCKFDPFILSIVVTSANRHEISQIEAVLDAIVIVRPEETEPHLFADKSYHGDPARRAIEARNYTPHVKKRGEEIEAKKYSGIQASSLDIRGGSFLV